MQLNRFAAATTAIFPVLLTIGILLIPIVSNYADHDSAQRQVEKSRRWFWGHLISAVAFGFGILACCSLVLYLYMQELLFWPTVALPLVVTGAALQAAGLGADGIGPLAIRKSGQPARLFFDGSRNWVTGIFIAGSILFSLGQIILVVALQNTPLLGAAVANIILVAAILFSVSTAIPSGYGLYVVALSSLIIYLPISVAFWNATGLPQLG